MKHLCLAVPLLLILLGGSVVVHAQAENPQSETKGYSVTRFGRNLLEDLSLQFRAPFECASHNPKTFAVGAVAIAGLIASDHLSNAWISASPQSTIRSRMQRLSDTGHVMNGFYLVAGIGVVGIVTGSSREKESSVMLAEAILTSSLWTTVLKAVSGRERPREREELHSDWEGPKYWNRGRAPSVSLRSFPSGHSTGAWAAATILASQYPRYGVVPILAYGGAAAMSYSRMVVDAHWLSDVVVGALIGIGSARQVLSARERRKGVSDDETGIRLGLNVSSQYRGVHLEYRF